jgi:hypothetical protein
MARKMICSRHIIKQRGKQGLFRKPEQEEPLGCLGRVM